MMTVTKIEPLSKTRYKVYLDGQFAFTLYKGELSRYHIAEESVIEDDIYDSLQQIITKRAKLRAMHLLSDMGSHLVILMMWNMREVLLTAGRNGKAKKNSMRHLCKKAFHQKL